jgi:hypothetical protein
MAVIPKIAAVTTMKKGRSVDSGPDIDEAETSLTVPMWMAAERPSVSRNELSSVVVVVIDFNAEEEVTSSADRVPDAGQGDDGNAGDETASFTIPLLQHGFRHFSRFDGATKASTTAVAASISMIAVFISGIHFYTRWRVGWRNTVRSKFGFVN